MCPKDRYFSEIWGVDLSMTGEGACLRIGIELLNNKWFGDYIKNYREGRGISLKQKVIAISSLILTKGGA